MAESVDGNGVTFKWVAAGLLTLVGIFAVAWWDGLEQKVEAVTKSVAAVTTVSNANATDIAVVKAVVGRVEHKVDTLLERK